MLKKLELIHPYQIERYVEVLKKYNNITLNVSNGSIHTFTDGVYCNPLGGFQEEGYLKTAYNLDADDVAYGVSDDHEQILEHHKALLSNPKTEYVIFLVPIKKSQEPSSGGWRWHKWGEYIGTQKPQHEYIYDEPNIEQVFVYSIYEVSQ